MRFAPLIPLLAVVHALPQATSTCSTSTVEVIVASKTFTYTTTPVSTVYPSTADNLGTFTQIMRLSETKTLQTLTATSTSCISGTSIARSTKTVYTTANTSSSAAGRRVVTPNTSKRVVARDSCPKTVTTTTTYGETYLAIAAKATSIYTEYTAFTMATVTSTSIGGTAYAIATRNVVATATCGGPTVTARRNAAATVTMDARCKPSSLISAAGAGATPTTLYGIEYIDDTPLGGASWQTNTTDAASCCQLCVNAGTCANSAWDSRTNACHLEFPVNSTTGATTCAMGVFGYYDAGPESPMAPGAGWWVGNICAAGVAGFGQAAPDDGT